MRGVPVSSPVDRRHCVTNRALQAPRWENENKKVCFDPKTR